MNGRIGSGSPMSLGFLVRFMVLPTRAEARNNIAAPSVLLVFVPERVAREGRPGLNPCHSERKRSRLTCPNLRESLTFC